MQQFLPFSHTSLRIKLVLSYLAVTLGAIFILAFAIGIAISRYFEATQTVQLQHLADGYQRSLIDPAYLISGKLDQPSLASQFRGGPEQVLLVITDPNGNKLLCVDPSFANTSNCFSKQIQDALNQTLSDNKTSEGHFALTMQKFGQDHSTDSSQGTGQDYVQETGHNHSTSPLQGSAPPPVPTQGTGIQTIDAQYLVLPLVEQGKTVGAMFLSAPQQNPYPFINQVNQTIFLSGIFISLIVVLSSFVLARRFTHPIEVLTYAADQMKHGEYAQRVPQPKTQDELGLLAQAFNEMANTIESDVNELRRQEQFRRDLIANIAHDLVTPLTAIQGFSEALADDIISGQEARLETAQRIGREVQRLRRLVSDMRNMTAMESGRTQLDLAPLDMQSLVDETLAVIAPECERAGISVSNAIAPNAPPVMADSDRVAQVLLNLLDNARRHTPEGGAIKVGARLSGEMLGIQVSDTGAGIAPEDLPYIFERFYRADRSRAAATGGSGLGLAIVKAIVNAHHGKIWAQSAPGQGTMITFTLPVFQEQLRSGEVTHTLEPLTPEPALESTGKSHKITVPRLTKLT